MSKPSKFAVRVIVVAALPFVVIFAFVARLLSEIRSAFRFAWLDVRQEYDAAVQAWRTGELPKDEGG